MEPYFFTKTWLVMGRRSLTKFVIALVATLVFGGATLAIVANQRLSGHATQARPTAAAWRPYTLEWRRSSDQTFRQTAIGNDGTGCEAVVDSDLLYRSCVLATNLDPAIIASEAFGRINVEATPSLEAVIWRGILSNDAGVCARAGLSGPFLAECQSAVEARQRTVTDHGLTVRIGAVQEE